MRKLFVVTLGALVAAAAFAPAAQARHHHKGAHAAVAAAPGGRTDKYGQFYATPVQEGDPSSVLLAPVLAPVGVAGAVAGGVADPILGGLDVLAAPLK